MGDMADDMSDMAQDWQDYGVQCPIHGTWYIELHQTCLDCEDGVKPCHTKAPSDEEDLAT